MRQSYIRSLIFLVLFVAGYFAVARTGTERLLFDDACIEARSFLMTVCRMGEVSETSLDAFVNALPHGYGAFDISLECQRNSGDRRRSFAADSAVIYDAVEKNGFYRFEYNDEVILKLSRNDHSFLCRGRVNGMRRYGED
ncbi:MAG: hypothetical protein K6E95_03620 [Lachnospiraceae bacterium]|nr:hypothetical protein [Lachnospiraceae bacterium]